MSIKNLALATVVGAFALTGAASAHVWNIGWKSTGGGLTFYGTSYHTGTINGAGSVDDFAANPAGFVLGGQQLTFDIGSATNLADCSGPGGLISGSCSTGWNSLSLDAALASTSYPSGSTYGKYAFATLTAAQLSTYGITKGANSVTLGTFSRNVHWANRPFASATVPIDIVVKPPSQVPLPAAGFLLLAGIGGLGMMRRKKNS